MSEKTVFLTSQAETPSTEGTGTNVRLLGTCEEPVNSSVSASRHDRGALIGHLSRRQWMRRGEKEEPRSL
ncbi:hypothetical protein TNCV_3433931 [Trichonephila clavipes]|nr:hypothetical protein TNCV_3433931 [Trichonephila clavipes]